MIGILSLNHNLVFTNDEESFWESTDTNHKNQQEIEHVIHNDEDWFNKRSDFSHETHVIHAFEPHVEDQDGFNDSYVSSTKADILVDKSHEIGYNDIEIYNAPNSEACLKTQTFSLHQEHKCIKNIKYSTNHDNCIWVTFRDIKTTLEFFNILMITDFDSIIQSPSNVSHFFICKQLNVNKHQMEQIRRKKSQHDSFAVRIIQKLNDDLHVRSHEHFSILLAQHCIHED